MDNSLKALRKLHNVERLATEIYSKQIRTFSDEFFKKRLVVARDNEQEHIDALYSRIIDLGGTKSNIGWAFQLAGKILGFSSILLGKRVIFKFDIKVEEKAVRDYGNFLDKEDFDEKSRKLIEKNLEDEKIHIQRWQDSLEVFMGKPSQLES